MKSLDHEFFFTCDIDMKFSERWLSEAVQLLLSAAGCTEAKPGCRECLISRDATHEGLVHYREQWNSESAFKEHLKSDEFMRVLVAMDLCSEEPAVVVGNLTGRRGIAWLRELRDGKNTQDVVSND